MPLAFVDVPRGQELKQGSSYLNSEEAEAVVRVARLCVEHVGFAPAQISVLTFYNAQARGPRAFVCGCACMYATWE